MDSLIQGLKIRKFEQLLLQLYSKGYLSGTVHTCIGQELTAVLVAKSLKKGDVIFSNHRGHGHYLSHTKDFYGLLAEVLGKKTGCSGGYGGSQHIYKSGQFFSNGIQGGMAPIASGFAWSLKINSTDNIAVLYIGDGTLGQGILYEAMNIASKKLLPILIILEHNGIAQSTFSEETFSGDIKSRVEGFGFEYLSADSHNLEQLESQIVNGVSNSRKYVPTFLEVKSYRLNSHSKGDDNRNTNLIDQLWADDILNNSTFEGKSQIEEEFEKEFDEIFQKILLDEDLIDIDNPNCIASKAYQQKAVSQDSEKRINELINEALHELLQNNKSVILGEDVKNKSYENSKEYGGAFKVTRNLSDIFPEQIFNMPISEPSIVGVGTGLALGGQSPIVEIMFGDFMTLTFDQIYQHASKFQLMYHDSDLNTGVMIRTPMGGKRGYGPTHSQSIEKFFLGIPDFHVFAINHRLDIKSFYKKLHTLNKPKLVIENKLLYNVVPAQSPIPGYYSVYETDCEFPTIIISPKTKQPELTIACYGGTLIDAENALKEIFFETEKLVEVVCFSNIHPICNMKPLLDSLQKTKKLLILEEGAGFAAWSSEIAAYLLENKIQLDALKRISNNNIIPSSYKAETNLLLSPEKILEEVKLLF